MRTLVCLLAIWLTTLLPAQAAPLPEADWYAEAMEGALSAVCVDGDATYLLRENELWLTDGELNPTECVHTFDRAVKGVCVEQGAVYSAWRDGDEMRFARSLPGGEAETLFSVPVADRLLELEVRGGIMIAQWRLSAEEAMQGNHGRQIELYDMSGRMLAQAFGMDAAFCGEDILLLGDDGLTRWELATGEMHSVGTSYGYAVAVSQDDKTAYLWGDGLNEDGKLLIARCDLSDGQAELLSDEEWPAHSDFANLICTADALIGYEIRSGSFFVGSGERGILPPQTWPLEMQEQPLERRVLNLVSYNRGYPWMSNEMDAAMAMFRELHPEAEIRVTAMEREQIATSLLSGDGEIDVLYLNSMDAYDMVQAGALLDLNSDAELRAELETWIGSEAMVLDGMRYGVTLEIHPDTLVKNEAIARYAPQIDWQNGDWLKILQAAEGMQTDLNGDGAQDVWFLWDYIDAPMWRNQYVDSFDRPEAVDFDTEYFRALAQQYERCVQLGLILNADADFEQRDLAAYQFGYAARPLDGAAFCPAPLIDGRRVVSGSTHSLAVPRSADVDLAMDFLRCYASDEAQRAGYSVGYKADSSLYAEYAEMTAAQRENLAAHAAYVGQVRTKWNDSDFNRHANGEMARYLADEISLDEMVSSLQRKLEMTIWG